MTSSKVSLINPHRVYWGYPWEIPTYQRMIILQDYRKILIPHKLSSPKLSLKRADIKLGSIYTITRSLE